MPIARYFCCTMAQSSKTLSPSLLSAPFSQWAHQQWMNDWCNQEKIWVQCRTIQLVRLRPDEGDMTAWSRVFLWYGFSDLSRSRFEAIGVHVLAGWRCELRLLVHESNIGWRKCFCKQKAGKISRCSKKWFCCSPLLALFD